MKKKTKILMVLILIAVVAFIIFKALHFFDNEAQDSYLETHYIFDKTLRTGQAAAEGSGNPYLFQGSITPRALELFRLMERKFPSQSARDMTGHYDAVRRYFKSRFSEADAGMLFDVYQKYLPCQIKLLNDSRFEIKNTNLQGMLALLYRVQIFRREAMGKETADALFGAEVKEKEYFLRREMVIADPALYGRDKERRLDKLKSDMWEGEAIPIGEDDTPYNRYQLKMQLYAKDLAGLGEKERKLKIEEFRKEFFTREQIGKLRDVDARMSGEQETLKRYREAEKKILEARDMPRALREQKINALQDDYFGEEADAFRRTEAIRKGLEKQ